jgi:hypothetical protein
LIKARVRAHRWQLGIETGRAWSITDLAEQDGVTSAYVCRVLPLTRLAPDIIGDVERSVARSAIAMRGRAAEGAALTRRGLEELEATGAILHRPLGLALLARSLGASGAYTEAVRTADAALGTGSLDRTGAAANQRLPVAGVRQQQSGGCDVLRAVDCPVARASDQVLELRAATSLARLWAEQGERQKAYDMLAPVYR